MQLEKTNPKNLTHEPPITKKIHYVKDRILSYQDTVKARYEAKLHLMNKNLSHLEHERDKCITECNNIQLSKVAEDVKLREEQVTVDFLTRENLLIQEQINAVIKRIQAKKQSNQEICFKTIALKQVLAQQKRKLAQNTGMHQELLQNENQKNQRRDQKKSRNKTIISILQSPLLKQQNQETNILSSSHKKHQFSPFQSKIYSKQLIHQCHLNFMNNQTVKQQLKMKQQAIRNEKESSKKSSNRQSPFQYRPKKSSSFDICSDKNIQTKSLKKQPSKKMKQNLRLRSSSLASHNTNKNSHKSQSSNPVLPSLDLGFKYTLQAFPQPFETKFSGLDKLMITSQTFYKLEEIQKMRKRFQSINSNQLINLIMRAGIMDKVLSMIEMDKLTAVEKYEKLRKAHQKHHLKLKL